MAAAQASSAGSTQPRKGSSGRRAGRSQDAPGYSIHAGRRTSNRAPPIGARPAVIDPP
jgi:hypothetical protein